jgi:hypothetical protein
MLVPVSIAPMEAGYVEPSELCAYLLQIFNVQGIY